MFWERPTKRFLHGHPEWAIRGTATSPSVDQSWFSPASCCTLCQPCATRQLCGDKMIVYKLFWAPQMSDLNQQLDYHQVRYSMVMAKRRIILTEGEADIFVSLVCFSHSVWSKLGIFPGMMSCLLGHLCVSLDEEYPELYVYPTFLLFKPVGNLLLPVLKEKWGLCSTVLSPNYLNFTLEDKSSTLARQLFRRLQQLEIQEEQICCSIPIASPDTVNKKSSWLRTRWKLWNFRLISSGSSSWKNPAFSDLILARWKMPIYLKKTERFVLSYLQYIFLPNVHLPYYGININIDVWGFLFYFGINIVVNTTQDQNLPRQVQIFFLNLPISHQQTKWGRFKITLEDEYKN